MDDMEAKHLYRPLVAKSHLTFKKHKHFNIQQVDNRLLIRQKPSLRQICFDVYFNLYVPTTNMEEIKPYSVCKHVNKTWHLLS